MHLSEFEQRIYNVYLRKLRKEKNFKYRKNFDSLDDENKIALKQLSSFFTEFPNINVNDFFEAGFRDAEYRKLSYFKTYSAISAYNRFISEQTKNIDSEWVKNFIHNSILFINNFCNANKILIDEYLEAKSESGIPWFVIHLKEMKVSIFLLLAFDTLESNILRYADDIKLIIGDTFFEELGKHRTSFAASKTCKQYARIGLQLIRQKQTKNKQ